MFDRVFDARHGGCAVEIFTEVAGIDRRKPRRRLVFLPHDRAAECDADLKRPALAYAVPPTGPLRLRHKNDMRHQSPLPCMKLNVSLSVATFVGN